MSNETILSIYKARKRNQRLGQWFMNAHEVPTTSPEWSAIYGEPDPVKAYTLIIEQGADSWELLPLHEYDAACIAVGRL